MFGVDEANCSTELPSGCTDQEACNFDPTAIIDDQSCTFPGCLDPAAINWNPNAGCDAPCEYEGDCPTEQWLIVELYDSFGDGWNGAFYMIYYTGGLIAEGTLPYGSYQLDVVSLNGDCEIDGYTDPTAFNFLPTATLDDGSCLYNGGNFGFTSDVQASPSGLSLAMTPRQVIDAVKLSLTGLQKNLGLEVMVVDMMGRMVRDEHHGNDSEHRQLEMNFSDLSNGMYFTIVRQDDHVESVQFVVAH